MMRQQLGILRSFLIYYGIPGRHKRLRHFYSQFIQPGDLCFDIGAHVGNRTRTWAGLGAHVIALEPQPHLLNWLHRLFDKNPNVTILGQGVGAQLGQATLHISQLTPTVSTLSAEWITAVQTDPSFANVKWDDAVTIDVVTLDQLIAEYGRPAFCKIDVEGYELEVLKGLSQPLPVLSFEVIASAKDLAVACLDLLSQLSEYQFNYAAGETHRWQFDQWISAEAMVDFLQGMETGSGDVYCQLVI